MSVSLQSASVYTDLHSLEAVKHGADENSPETLRFVAQQFEALLIQTMLKAGRDTQQEGGLFDSEQSEFYQDLHDKQLGLHLAQGQGIGIADMLVQQLRAARGLDATAAEQADGRNLSAYLLARIQSPRPVQNVESAEPVVAPVKATVEIELGTPEAFVEHLWPHAKQAAASLGVDPVVVLAQAALETGWGRHVIRHPDGHSSHNLFNIKADGRWDGENVSMTSLEYQEGLAKRERSQFRSYDSFAESFADYAAFLQQSPRYQAALEAGQDGARFASELASAGYATDPNYASKIIGIVEGEPLGKALGTLKVI